MSGGLREQNGKALAEHYRHVLLDNVIPFWLRHGLDREHGGMLTSLDRDGSLLDTDKSIWFQGRSAWMFATLYNTVRRNQEWLEAAKSCINFLRDHGSDASGKLYFSVTRDGKPLRIRRYVYSESFAAIANASYARATEDEQAAEDAVRYFGTFLHYSFSEGVMQPKVDVVTRPSRSIGPLMIGIATAQELRSNLGDVTINARTCTQWIDWAVDQIEQYFLKPELEVLMEVVGPQGELIDHFEGRQLNPGHAIECAWFLLHEGKHRSDSRMIRMGLNILDWMWKRGWDEQYGGLFYFRDVRGLPVQEYWHDMKFWWPHCEAIIATLLAWQLTHQDKYADWHQQVHDWSFQHFSDPEHGEWYGYLHRDGSLSSRLKGNLWKGPFHLPRMLWYGWQLLHNQSDAPERG